MKVYILWVDDYDQNYSGVKGVFSTGELAAKAQETLSWSDSINSQIYEEEVKE